MSNPPTFVIISIAYNGTIWVAAGGSSISLAVSAGGVGDGRLAYSYDGFTWNSVSITSIIPTTIRAVIWNGSMFVAGGGNTNQVGYSYDGINWFSSVITGTPFFITSLASRYGSALPNLYRPKSSYWNAAIKPTSIYDALERLAKAIRDISGNYVL